MSMDRREFIKANAAAAAMSAAGMAPVGEALAQGKDEIRWDKAACRFCGTGCGVLVGTQDGRVVARSELLAQVWSTHFDPGSNLIDVQISRLRDKLGDSAWMIDTVRGKGYRLRREPP